MQSEAPLTSPLGAGYVFSLRFASVAAAILAAVEGGILPPGPEVRNGSDFSSHTPFPPGRMPGSTAGKMPAATLNTCRAGRGGLDRTCLGSLFGDPDTVP